MYRNVVLLAVILLSLPTRIYAGDQDIRKLFVGKSDCIPELQSPKEYYGIRLDKSQNAFLAAYRTKENNLLIIVQYKAEGDRCGTIRDVVESREFNSAFVWECVDQSEPAKVVVGAWSENHKGFTGRAAEAWNVDLKQLKFTHLSRPVACMERNYAGSDDGTDLLLWAKERAARVANKK